MSVSSVENQDIGVQVRMFFAAIFAKSYSLCFQSARKLEAVPSPDHFPPVQGPANVEVMAMPPKQSKEGEAEKAEKAGRKSLLMQLQMIIDKI